MAALESVIGWMSHLTQVDERVILEHLDSLLSEIPEEKLVEIPLIEEGTALVVGDTHGDWPTVRTLVERYLKGHRPVERFVMLGDFVDRTPEELPYGSLANALYVLSLRGAFPERFLCLRGNHEAGPHVPLPVSEIREEARQLWGSTRVSDMLEDIFERLPLAAVTASGAYLAHAGYPMNELWRDDILRPTERTWLEVLWNDVDISPIVGTRGIEQPPMNGENLSRFLDVSGLGVVIRGHDPYVAGRRLYDDRLLTIHTTRAIEGVKLLAALLPLGERLTTLHQVKLIELSLQAISRSI